MVFQKADRRRLVEGGVAIAGKAQVAERARRRITLIEGSASAVSLER